MAKRGRPSVFTTKLKKQMEFLAKKGFTEQEMADALGIDQSTITKYKQRNPDFFTSLKDWKAEADVKVERSLYERACGYSHPETKAQWVDDYIQDENGELKKVGRWEYAKLVRHYPPDATSMIFWLKNRQPDKWRDKVENETYGKDGGPIEHKWQIEVVEAQ